MRTRMTQWILGLAAIPLLTGLSALAADNTAQASSPTGKISLFNGTDCAGWVKFIPDAAVDVDEIWTVRDGVLHCVGKPNGYIRTEKAYRDYRLHLEWRWAETPSNSGVLLHAQLPDQVWPRTVEAQLQHQKAGDFWLLSFSTIKDKDGTLIGPKQYANLAKQQPSSEKPAGEWNAYDIVCDQGSVTLTVNGVLQNRGLEADPSSGYICLQSEGSPIQFRNVYLEPLKP